MLLFTIFFLLRDFRRHVKIDRNAVFSLTENTIVTSSLQKNKNPRPLGRVRVR